MLRLAARILAVAYLPLLTFGLASQSVPVMLVRSIPRSEWLATVAQGGHFLAMMTLGIIVTLARPPLSRIGLGALLLMYALLMEFLHGLLPARSFEWMDLFQNVSGVLIGMVLVQLLASLANRQRITPAPDDALSVFARVHDSDHAGTRRG